MGVMWQLLSDYCRQTWWVGKRITLAVGKFSSASLRFARRAGRRAALVAAVATRRLLPVAECFTLLAAFVVVVHLFGLLLLPVVVWLVVARASAVYVVAKFVLAVRNGDVVDAAEQVKKFVARVRELVPAFRECVTKRWGRWWGRLRPLSRVHGAFRWIGRQLDWLRQALH